MAQFSVTAGGATKIIDGSTNSSVSFPQSGIIKNATGASASIYVDTTSSVTAGTGFLIAAGEAISVDVVNENLYAISASGTIVVYVITRY